MRVGPIVSPYPRTSEADAELQNRKIPLPKPLFTSAIAVTMQLQEQ